MLVITRGYVICLYLSSQVLTTCSQSVVRSAWLVLISHPTVHISNQLLVGGLNPSEKYSSIGMIIPNI